MGSIVAGYGTGHILLKRHSAGEAGERVFAGMQEIGRRARAMRPDVLIIVSSDHLYHFDLSVQAPFVVAVSDSLTPYGDMHLPRDPLPGSADFGAGLVRHAASKGFDLAVCEQYRPDHGVVIPYLMIDRERRIPVVPILTNTAMDPPPEPSRCWQLAGVIGDFVRHVRPASERVVIVGTGGLSHWLGCAEMGRVNPAFDNDVLDKVAGGAGVELARLSAGDVVREGGNGGLEIINWLVMAGTLPGAAGERIYYEALTEWMTGMGGVELKPAKTGAGKTGRSA